MSREVRWRRGEWFAALCLLLWVVPIHAHAYRTAANSSDFPGADRVAWRSYEQRFDVVERSRFAAGLAVAGVLSG